MSVRKDLDFCRFQTKTLIEEDYNQLEQLEDYDLAFNFQELKEQLIGLRVEWLIDVQKCFDDLNGIFDDKKGWKNSLKKDLTKFKPCGII